MTVRSTMSALIAQERLLIGDPSGASAQFQDQDIQNKLDEYRDDLRYLPLAIAPSIVNAASTGNQAATIFADYYSDGYQWWEADAVLQGVNTGTGAAWVVITPLASDFITGHWQFDSLTPTVDGTVPGQYPPLFVTGKVYDLYRAASDLLTMWAATLTCAYDVTVNGQSLHRSQLMTAKLTLARYYRTLAKPMVARMNRTDINPETHARRYRLLDSDERVKGGGV